MVIALDIEGTLISNGVSQFARPGLRAFLEFCLTTFDRVVVFTSLPQQRFRFIAQGLVERGEAPEWFAVAEFVSWRGPLKRLEFIRDTPLHEVLLLDDMEAYIPPEQRGQWIRVSAFEYPYSASDRELERLAALLADRVRRAHPELP